MADEITLQASLAYADSEGTSDSLTIFASFLASVSTKKMLHLKQAVGTSEAALNLGGISAPGWLAIVNRDATNYVSLRRSSGETEAARLHAGGGGALLFLGSGAQAPYLIANTAACQVEFLLCSQ